MEQLISRRQSAPSGATGHQSTTLRERHSPLPYHCLTRPDATTEARSTTTESAKAWHDAATGLRTPTSKHEKYLHDVHKNLHRLRKEINRLLSMQKRDDRLRAHVAHEWSILEQCDSFVRESMQSVVSMVAGSQNGEPVLQNDYFSLLQQRLRDDIQAYVDQARVVMQTLSAKFMTGTEQSGIEIKLERIIQSLTDASQRELRNVHGNVRRTVHSQDSTSETSSSQGTFSMTVEEINYREAVATVRIMYDRLQDLRDEQDDMERDQEIKQDQGLQLSPEDLESIADGQKLLAQAHGEYDTACVIAHQLYDVCHARGLSVPSMMMNGMLANVLAPEVIAGQHNEHSQSAESREESSASGHTHGRTPDVTGLFNRFGDVPATSQDDERSKRIRQWHVDVSSPTAGTDDTTLESIGIRSAGMHDSIPTSHSQPNATDSTGVTTLVDDLALADTPNFSVAASGGDVGISKPNSQRGSRPLDTPKKVVWAPRQRTDTLDNSARRRDEGRIPALSARFSSATSGSGQKARQPPWQYDATVLNGYYYYLPNTNEIVLKDGRKFPKPPNFNPPTLEAARFQPEPNVGQTYGRQTGAGPQSTSSQARPRTTPPMKAPDVEGLTHDMETVAIQRLPENQIQVTNRATGVTNTYQAEPAQDVTDPALLHGDRRAELKFFGTVGEAEPLHDDYRKRPAKFFAVGRVLMILWAEPAGENNHTAITALIPGHLQGRYGERVFSKVRRFVVVRASGTYCSAVPVTTYGGLGVARPGVNKSEHAIIYSGRSRPGPLQDEMPTRQDNGQGMRPVAIHVTPDNRVDKLDVMSRIDFGKVSTIQYNVKVKPFGMVTTGSMQALLTQFRSVWLRQVEEPQTAPPAQPSGNAPTAGASAATSNARAEQLIKALIGKGCSPENAKALVAQRLREPGAQTMTGKQASIAEAQAGTSSSTANVNRLYKHFLGQGYSTEQAGALLAKHMVARPNQADNAKEPAAEAATFEEEEEEVAESDSDSSDEDDVVDYNSELSEEFPY